MEISARLRFRECELNIKIMQWPTAVLLLAIMGGVLGRVHEMNTAMTDLPRVRTHPWHSLEHHAPKGGFRNPWGPPTSGSVWKGMKWFLGQTLRSKTNRLPPVRPIDPLALARRPDQLSMTWIGHSTMLVRTPSQTVILDPMFSDRASPYSFAGPEREPGLPLPIDGLSEIDVVLISHDHYDHLDGRSIRRLAARHDPLFLVPLGVGRYVHGWGASRVLEMDWWQYVDLDGIRYHAVPAKHFSGRGLFDRDQTLWLGWYLEGIDAGIDVYYAGDTAYSPHFMEIRAQIGTPDVALLPIGAYLPPWLMQPVHVNPEEALRAFGDLRASHFIPVHWGTFDMAEEPLHAPADTLRRLVEEQALHEEVHLLDIGQSWQLPD